MGSFSGAFCDVEGDAAAGARELGFQVIGDSKFLAFIVKLGRKFKYS